MPCLPIFRRKYRYVKTKKLMNVECCLCKEKHDYYRTFYRVVGCQHLIHKQCYDKYVGDDHNKCPKCDNIYYEKQMNVHIDPSRQYYHHSGYILL